MSAVCDQCGMGWFKHRHNHASLPDCPNYRVLRGGHNQCTGCGEYFKSNSAFALHRRAGACLTPAEMRAKGMVQVADKHDGLWWVEELRWKGPGSTDSASTSRATG
jgi:hypothetical protein